MRIAGFRVENFRGLRAAHTEGLDATALVTVSGPNGSGKSLLFEAIALISRLGLPPDLGRWGHLVGPWGDTAELELSISLTEDERSRLGEWAGRVGYEDSPPAVITRSAQIVRSGSINRNEDQWASLVRRLDTLSELPFLQLDYLPADRTVPRGEQANVNPAILGEEQRENFRQQIVGSFINQRGIVNLSGVAPVLASLDYTDLLAEREGRESTGQFDAITESFFRSTGKRILRPSLDPASPYGASLLVETPEGMRHTIDQLSSGEQEALGLMFFVLRLSARGGVLLIDEPELHLHPALQRSLFAVLEGIADRAQVVISTHSPRLVTATALDAVLHMNPPNQAGTNQLRPASDQAARLDLLDDLGVHPVEVMQSDFLVVTEGSTDVSTLEALAPVELGRAVIRGAGDARHVEAACRALSGEAGLRFVGIRDRDLMTVGAVAELESHLPGLYVWPTRMLENELLRPELVQRTLERAGRAIELSEVEHLLRGIADEQREVITAELVDARLRDESSYEAGGSRSREALGAYLEEIERSAAERRSRLDGVWSSVEDELDETWDRRWFELMDGKRALGALLRLTPFRSKRDYVDAVAQAVREEENLLPDGIRELRRRLIAAASTPR